MSLGHGAKIVRDGLVFHYDMANTKSWRGRPITNIVSNTNLDTGWSKTYNVNIEWNDYPSPIGINSDVVSFVDADGNGSGYWYSYGNYAPQGDGVTYYVSVWARTVGQDWTIRPYTGDNSEANRIWLDQLTVPGDGKWHRLEFNPITTANPNDSDSLSFSFSYIPPNQKCWLCAPQMTEHGHVPFVDGTRSATESIIDLTGKSIVTVDNLTYNTDGTFEFNPNGEITIPHSSDIAISNQYSGELWVWANQTQNNLYPRLWDKGSVLAHITQTPPYTIAQNTSTADGLKQVSAGGALDHSTWTHIVTTYDGRYGKIYVNGTLIANSDFGADRTPNLNTGNMAIGGGPSDTGRQFDGKISTARIYHKALTATEVKQNFNATRGRYGI